MNLARMPGLSLLKKIGPTLTANLFNQVVVLSTQILVVPLLIQSWGLSGFGTWVVLSAIPTYLTISDLGFSYSAKSDMAVRAAAGQMSEAIKTLSSTLFISVVLLSVFSVVYVAVSFAFDWPRVLNLSGVSEAECVSILLLGLAQVIAYQMSMQVCAVLRAAGRPAGEVTLSAMLRLAETSALAIAALITRNIVVAAIAWSCTRVVMTILAGAFVYIAYPALRPRVEDIDKARIFSLLPASLAFMAMPLANALILQGSSLVLSATTSAAVVAIFAAVRTVTRAGVSGANILLYTFVPYYSYAVGARNISEMKRLVRLHAIALIGGGAAYVVIMFAGGNWFIGILSRHMAQPGEFLIWLMVLAALLEMGWGLSLAVATATNHVVALSSVYAVLCVIGIALCYVGSTYFNIIGIAATVAVVHLAMLIYSLGWAKKNFLSIQKAI